MGFATGCFVAGFLAILFAGNEFLNAWEAHWRSDSPDIFPPLRQPLAFFCIGGVFISISLLLRS